jgi:hypothetical protein
MYLLITLKKHNNLKLFFALFYLEIFFNKLIFFLKKRTILLRQYFVKFLHVPYFTLAPSILKIFIQKLDYFRKKKQPASRISNLPIVLFDKKPVCIQFSKNLKLISNHQTFCLLRNFILIFLHAINGVSF